MGLKDDAVRWGLPRVTAKTFIWFSSCSVGLNHPVYFLWSWSWWSLHFTREKKKDLTSSPRCILFRTYLLNISYVTNGESVQPESIVPGRREEYRSLGWWWCVPGLALQGVSPTQAEGEPSHAVCILSEQTAVRIAGARWEASTKGLPFLLKQTKKRALKQNETSVAALYQVAFIPYLNHLTVSL